MGQQIMFNFKCDLTVLLVHLNKVYYELKNLNIPSQF